MSVSWLTLTPTINTTTIPDGTNPPYTTLPGSGPVAPNGDDPATLLAADELAHFPRYSWTFGQTLTPPSGNPPAGFSMNATFDQFNSWTSDWQCYMMDLWRNQTNSNAGVTLTDSAGASHYLIRSVSDNVVYQLDRLQKRDFAAMSKADQDLVAADSFFRNSVAANLGLVPDASTSAADALASINTYLDNVYTSVQNKASGNYYPGFTTDVLVFKGELDNLKTRIASTGIYDINDIKSKVDEIEKRLNRAWEFMLGIIRNNPTYASLGNYDANRPSTDDNGANFEKAYKIFMAQEKRMLAVDNQSLQLAASGTIADKRMDAPTLIYLFQQYSMLKVEAENSANSEEVNQFNVLLKLYQSMQSMINEIVKKFDPKKSDEKRGFDGSTSRNSANLPTIARMFEDLWGTQINPMEYLYHITRPKQDMVEQAGNPYKYNLFFRDGWNAFSTQLGDVVTQLNQESQILMNTVNTQDKEKNRHFDLANNALSKLYDVLNNISRIG